MGDDVKDGALSMVLIAATAAACTSAPTDAGALTVDADRVSPELSPTPVAAQATLQPSPSENALSCDDLREGAGSAPEASIAGVLAGDAEFSRFCTLVETAFSPGLGQSWLEIWDWPANRMGDNQDGVTVFVPTNNAFDSLDPALVAAIEDGTIDNQMLYSLIGHHYVHRLYPSSDFEEGPQPTWRGPGTVHLSLDPLTYGDCNVVETDIRARNGFVHAIDCVVVPEELAEAVAP